MIELRIDQNIGSTMVLVPHQDDEILLTAGLLNQLVEAGVPVTVVMVTNGDYGCVDETKGQIRLKETLLGTTKLGVEKSQVYFLGYADTGMPVQDSFLMKLYLEKDEKKIYPSFCSNQTYGMLAKAEYHMERYQTHASYTREHLKEDLKQVIKEILPKNIFTTLEFDTHGDHKGLFKFLEEILDELQIEIGYEPKVYGGLVHSCAGDDTWPKPHTAEYSCPEGFEENSTLKWEDRICLKMKENMKLDTGENNLKYQALLQYETALEPDAYEFLMSFVKEEEIFWRVR